MTDIFIGGRNLVRQGDTRDGHAQKNKQMEKQKAS